MKVCLILCFLNALTSSKKKFAQTYGKNRDINHDLCLNLSLSPIQTLQMGRRARSYAGEIKSETFNLTDISAYFRYRKEVEGDNLLSDQTYSDLGVEELFTFADRTVSRVRSPSGRRDQPARKDHPSFAGGQPSTGTAGQNTIPFARHRSLQYRTIIGRRATSRLHKPKGHFCYLEMPSGSVSTSLSAPSYTCLRVVLPGCHYLECRNPLHLQA